jgi:tetratricopeptide (TPR) repeat protein
MPGSSGRHNGQVVTFYSYKGGTGRTMALANVAWILAANGRHVLIVDWDLESPGLHRYFPQSVLPAESLGDTKGVIDMVREFEYAATLDEPGRPLHWQREYARIHDHAIRLRWPFAGGGYIHFLSAGLQNNNYSAAVASRDWDKFYEDLGGGDLFDAMREDMKENYDFAFVDSRTGLSDVADICTLHLPDVLVNCFTLNNQNIDGAAKVARTVAGQSNDHVIRILPVPMRVDDAEKDKADAGRAAARAQFGDLVGTQDPGQASRYWGSVEVPYQAFYNYEETLAVFGDQPGLPGSLLAAYERLTSALTDGEVSALPPMTDSERKVLLDEVSRRRLPAPDEVTVLYLAQDRMWADWVESALRQAGIRSGIAPLRPQGPQPPDGGYADRVIAVMSADFQRDRQAMATARTLADTGRLVAVAVSELRLEARLPGTPMVELGGLAERDAHSALLRGLGLGEVEPMGLPTGSGARFPSITPRIWGNVPARNASFTGRDSMMERLRDQVIGGSPAVILPVALHGLGGVGKTQLALEYAHRFKADYDLVWWVNAEDPAFINAAMSDLAARLGLGGSESVPETAAAARDALRRGEPYDRWLLVFDNAREPAELSAHMPDLPGGGNGHVLVTSRIQAWAHQGAEALEVDVFTRAETVEHLTRAVPGLTEAEASSIGELVGDLPLAVETAAAWLASSAVPASQYLEALAAESTRVLSLNKPQDYPETVAAAWNLAIARLREREPAAGRLLELCAFMNPNAISIDLVQSDQMAAALRPYNEFVTEKMVIGKVTREAVLLSLIKADPNQNALVMHRLVQQAVRDQLDNEQQEATSHAVHEILAGARPPSGDIDDPSTWPLYAGIWPHLTPSRAVECLQDHVRQLLIDRVRYQWKRGEFDQGLELGRSLESAWEANVEAYGRETPGGLSLYRQLLNLRTHIASILRSQGRYQESYDLDLAVLEDQGRVLFPGHPHALLTASCLAADLRGLGRYQESLNMERTTYEDHKRALGEDHSRTLSAANNLAISLRLVGDFAKALELDEDTVNRRRVVSGDRHPYTLTTRSHLARDLRDTGQYTQSANILRAILDDYREVLGENGIETLRAAKSLAVALRKADRLDEALTLSQQTYERYQREFGRENPDSLACAAAVAADLSAIGDQAGAIRVAEEVLESYRHSLGVQHPFTLSLVNNLATYVRKQGDPQRARDLCDQARAGLTALLGPAHPYSLAASGNLANALADADELVKAAELERTVADGFRATVGLQHPDTLAAESNRLLTIAALGDTTRVLSQRERLLNLMTNALGDHHGNTLAVREGVRLDWDVEPQPV